MWDTTVERLTRRVTVVDDDAWFACAAVSDLERTEMSKEKGLITKGPQVAPISHLELRNGSMTVGLDLGEPRFWVDWTGRV